MRRVLLVFAGRALRLLTLLVALVLFSFFLVSRSPIDPVSAYVGADMNLVSPEQRQRIEEYWGLNDPMPTRMARWFSSILHGDFGTSMIYRRPVLAVVGERFKASLLLMFTAWFLSGIIGIFLGLLAGARSGGLVDRAIRWYCLAIASTPAFWLGILMIIVFSVWLRWTPIGLAVPAGVEASKVSVLERLHHLVLPALTLSMVGVANITLFTRQKVVEALKSEYVLFARAKGESERSIILRHIPRNVSLPAVTLLFASFSELFGGSVLVETVFTYPGLGQATVQSALRGDVPLLLGTVIFGALFVFFGNLTADAVYLLIDPRMRSLREGNHREISYGHAE
ncbi:ABC transporter permease [Candidatus Solincola sp.]|nr:ABC transporter permease [Actinomycetota bacterium]